MAQDRKKILVLGAGYAGLNCNEIAKSDINRRSRNYAY